MDIDVSSLQAVAASQNLPVDDVTAVVAAALTDAYTRMPDATAGAVIVADSATGKFVLLHDDGAISATPAAFSRTAAATARQAIVQWMRDQDRRRAVGPWADREGRVVRATVVRHVPARGKNGPETQMRVDGVDAVLPAGEAIDGETLSVGAQVQVLLLAANVDDRDRIRLTVSRRQPALVSALFATVVPELVAGTVHIAAIARDPGTRTKVAVDGEGDVLAAMVGPAGARIRTVMSALAGEKIDVVVRHPELCDFVAAALTPGVVNSASLSDPARRAVTVAAAPEQMANVCGRMSANVRLAQRLTGARIEVVAA